MEIHSNTEILNILGKGKPKYVSKKKVGQV